MNNDENPNPDSEDRDDGNENSEEEITREDVEREFGDDLSDEHEKKSRNKPKKPIGIRLWRSLFKRRRLWRQMRHGSIERKDKINIALTAGILIATGAQALIYWNQSGFMQVGLFQTQKSIRLSSKTAQIAQNTLTEMKSSSTDTHALAVAAGKQADRMREQLPQLKQSADAALAASETAKKTLIASNRGWVGVSTPIVVKSYKNGEKSSYEVIIKNFGPSVALHVVNWANAVQPDISTLEEFETTANSAMNNACGNSFTVSHGIFARDIKNLALGTVVSSSPEGQTLFPNDNHLATFSSSEPMTKVREDRSLDIIGCISYRDQFGQDRQTKYCWTTTATIKETTFPAQLVPCINYNDAN